MVAISSQAVMMGQHGCGTAPQTSNFFPEFAWVASGAVSSDGRYFLLSGADNTARLWDSPPGQQLRSFVGHTDKVISVAFSADSRYVLTGSDDKTARLWDSATGQQ